MQRQRGFNQSALPRRDDAQFATEFTNALAHTGDADSAASVTISRKALAFVTNAQNDGVILDQKVDPGAFAGGMTVNVGEAFLENPEDRDFQRGRQTLRKVFLVQIYNNSTALREA